MTFQEIDEQRKILKIRQKALCLAAEIPAQSYTKWRRGKGITETSLIKLAAALEKLTPSTVVENES